jgi:ParB-like chromosome segregation protein Spo0J
VNLEDRSRPDEGGSETMTGSVVNTILEPYQVLPPLTEDEYAALKADIAANGVLIPIVVDQHGVIIDGHHRARIAEGLGIPYKRQVQMFASDEERHDAALGLNLKRRHLSREQMRELIAAECERTPDASDREIARRLGCSPSTVGAVRRPVSKLDTSPLSREDAEALTEAIRRRLDQGDRQCAEALAAGVPPVMLADAILQAWTKFAAGVNDAEFVNSMWRHIVAPRVQAILDGEWSA